MPTRGPCSTVVINFLALDDLRVDQASEPLDPRSVIRIPFRNGRPMFPRCERIITGPDLLGRRLHRIARRAPAIRGA